MFTPVGGMGLYSRSCPSLPTCANQLLAAILLLQVSWQHLSTERSGSLCLRVWPSEGSKLSDCASSIAGIGWRSRIHVLFASVPVCTGCSGYGLMLAAMRALNVPWACVP